MLIIFLLSGCFFRELGVKDKGKREEISQAIKVTNTSKLKSLLDGSTVNKEDSRQFTPLHEAAEAGNVEAIEVLVKRGAELNAVNGDSKTALMLAAEKGHKEVCKLLLEAGSNVNAVDEDGDTALMLASEREICRLLLEAGSNVNAASKDGRTALMEASYYGEEEVCKLLLEAGSDLEAVDEYGDTALLLAIKDGHKEVCKLLLEVGSNANVVNKFGDTVWTRATVENHKEEIYKLLLEAGSDVNVADEYGHTALMSVSRRGDTEACKVLLEAGSEVRAVDKHGYTALILAAGQGHAEMCKLLLEAGSEVKATGKDGWTALMVAAFNGHMEVCKLLLEAGSDVEAINNKKYGSTLWRFAVESGKSEICSLFIEKGMRINKDMVPELRKLKCKTTGVLERVVLDGLFDEVFKDYLEASALFSLKFLSDNFLAISELNKKRYLSIHFAAITESHELLEGLLRLPLALENINNDDNTDSLSPLRLALKYKRKENVKVLLAHGASPIVPRLMFGERSILEEDLYSYISRDALLYLLRLGRLRTAKDLIVKSFKYSDKELNYRGIIDLRVLDAEGRNAYHYLAAFCCEDTGVSEFLSRSFKMESFNKVLLNQMDNKGHTPMQLAVLHSNSYFIKYIGSLDDPTREDSSAKPSI